MEKGVVFFPDPHLYATPADYGLTAYEDVYFPASDGTRLHGWYVPGPDHRAVLLWLHGNAGNISYRLDNLKRLHDALKIAIFLFDYREYGRSEGHIDKAGTFADAEGAFRYVVEEKSFANERVLLFGRSLGTALAVYLAARKRVLGTVLEAAFTSTDDMMRLYFPGGAPHFGDGTKYDSMALIDQVCCPILFIHGAEDSTIPLEMAEALFDKAQEPKFFHVVPAADHNDTYLVGEAEYFKRLRRFLECCLERAKKG